MEQYSEELTINYFDADALENVKLSSLTNLMLLVSNNQLVSKGLGAKELTEQNRGWVVTQYYFEITRLPKLNETVKIMTEVTGYNRFFCYRDFLIYDQNEKLLLTVHSIWILMDLTTRNMVELTPEVTKTFAAQEVKRYKAIPKLKLADFEAPQTPYRIRYYDVDANRHVNNSHYFEWMTDVLPLDFVLAHDLVAINLKFVKEVKYGDEPLSKMQIVTTSDDEIQSQHFILNNGEVAAEAVLTWQKNNAVS